jgi:anti-anti-sigma regulatory factor
VTVFHLKGNLTEDERLLTRVQKAVEASTRYLLLDLTEVPYVSSRGLQALHRIYMLLRSNGDDVSDEEMRAGLRSGTYKSPYLKLLNPPKDVMKVLSLAGYDEFLEIHRSRRKAVASF